LAAAAARLGIRAGDPVAPEGRSRRPREPGPLTPPRRSTTASAWPRSRSPRTRSTRLRPPPTCSRSRRSREEVGCRGAVVAARLAKPDVVIVLEGLLADDLPGLAPYGEQQGALGAGVQVRAYDPTAIMNPRLVDLTLQARGRAGHPVPCGVLHGRHRRAFLPGP
jgi:endoglucanase